MTILMIKDLPLTEELGRKAMDAVHGGKGVPGWMPFYGAFMPEFKNFSFDAAQMVGQSQSVVNNNGNNAAFVGGIGSTLVPPQAGDNGISLI